MKGSANVGVVRRVIETNSFDYLTASTEDDRAALRVALWHPHCEYTSVVSAFELATSGQ